MPDSFAPPAKHPTSVVEPTALPADDSLPPPAYESPEVWNDRQQQPSKSSYPNEKPTTTPAPQYVQSQSLDQLQSSSSQQPLRQRPGTHLLHIYRESLLARNLTILDSDKTSVAYSVVANHGTMFSEKPHMKIYRGSTGPEPSSQPVGTATFHNLSRTIDLTFHKRAVFMESTSMLGVTHEFPSGIGPLRWKSEGWGDDLVLMTGDKQWLAKFDARSFSFDKRGILEVVSWDIQGEGLDEIVVSGVAMMEFMRRQRGE